MIQRYIVRYGIVCISWFFKAFLILHVYLPNSYRIVKLATMIYNCCSILVDTLMYCNIRYMYGYNIICINTYHWLNVYHDMVIYRYIVASLLCMCVCVQYVIQVIYAYTYLCTYIHTYIWTYARMYMHVCMRALTYVWH